MGAGTFHCLFSYLLLTVIFGMYADESYSYIQKDEMDHRVLDTEGHVSPALSDLFREVMLVFRTVNIDVVLSVTSCSIYHKILSTEK